MSILPVTRAPESSSKSKGSSSEAAAEEKGVLLQARVGEDSSFISSSSSSLSSNIAATSMSGPPRSWVDVVDMIWRSRRFSDMVDTLKWQMSKLVRFQEIQGKEAFIGAVNEVDGPFRNVVALVWSQSILFVLVLVVNGKKFIFVFDFLHVMSLYVVEQHLHEAHARAPLPLCAGRRLNSS